MRKTRGDVDEVRSLFLTFPSLLSPPPSSGSPWHAEAPTRNGETTTTTAKTNPSTWTRRRRRLDDGTTPSGDATTARRQGRGDPMRTRSRTSPRSRRTVTPTRYGPSSSSLSHFLSPSGMRSRRHDDSTVAQRRLPVATRQRQRREPVHAEWRRDNDETTSLTRHRRRRHDASTDGVSTM
jgi:hypothetical protein